MNDNSYCPMTPKEFAKRMKEIQKKKDCDEEGIHGDMDDLMCELLKELGYTEGIEIFENQSKWYA